jgi:ElaB/YqjD/DUF883 family membrane-anchored ribosome-binding protein
MNATQVGMTNDKFTPSFPSTRQDLSDLKTTAVVAANELRGAAAGAARELRETATVHAQKAHGQLNDLASHAQKESYDELNQAKVKLASLAESVRDYVAARPLASLGTALAIGFLIGFSRRGFSRAA